MEYLGSSQSSKSMSSVSSGFSHLGIPINEDCDIISINAQLLTLRGEQELLNHNINRGLGYQQDIYDHQRSTRDTLAELREKITELKANQKNNDKVMQEMADKRIEEVEKIAEPYLNSGQAPSSHQFDTVERCSKLLATVKGVSGALAKTRGHLPKRVMDNHHKINQMEAKQRDAMQRFEEVTRVQALQHDVSPSDPIYELAHLPQLLLALSISPTVSSSYKKIFKELEQRTAAFVAQYRFNGTTNGTAPIVENAEFVGSFESMSNGEIDLRSIFDNNEHPLDSLKVKTPELVN